MYGIEIKWQGQVVGYMRNPRIENRNWYGAWIPAENAASAEFLRRLEAEEELQVTFGDADAYLDQPPRDGEIDLTVVYKAV